MHWTKIPTNLLINRLSDHELVSIIKYQLLWADLEYQPDDKTALRYLTNKQLTIAKQWQDTIETQVKRDIHLCETNRNGVKLNYLKNKDKSKNLSLSLTASLSNSLDKQIREDKIKEKEIYKESSADDKPKGKPVAEKKLKETDIVDWNTLFTYWEQNKKGSKYKDDESRGRMLKKLKELTNNNLPFAKEAIFFAIDNSYQGFCNGSELYYKGKTANSFGNWDNF